MQAQPTCIGNSQQMQFIKGSQLIKCVPSEKSAVVMISFFKADKDDAVIMFLLQMLPVEFVHWFQSEIYIKCVYHDFLGGSAVPHWKTLLPGWLPHRNEDFNS